MLARSGSSHMGGIKWSSVRGRSALGDIRGMICIVRVQRSCVCIMSRTNETDELHICGLSGHPWGVCSKTFGSLQLISGLRGQLSNHKFVRVQRGVTSHRTNFVVRWQTDHVHTNATPPRRGGVAFRRKRAGPRLGPLSSCRTTPGPA